MTEVHVDMEGYFVNRLERERGGGNAGEETGKGEGEGEEGGRSGCVEVESECREYADIWMEILQEQLQHERCLWGRESGRLNNGTVYNGTAGLALLDLFLSQNQKFEMCPEDRDDLVQRAQFHLELSLRGQRQTRGKSRRRHMSFLGGDAGPLAMAIVFFSGQVAKGCSCEGVVTHYLNQLLKFLPAASNPCVDMPSEILCGRAGFLWALLYINSHFPCLIHSDIITQVVMGMVETGVPFCKDRRKHLMYRWRGRELLGAAHGLHGILYVLLKARDYWPVPDPAELDNAKNQVQIPRDRRLEELTGNQLAMEERLELSQLMFLHCPRKGKELPRRDVERWVLDSLDFLDSHIFASGNTLPATGHSMDKWVNWAHGAPGAIYTFIEAHKIFKEPKFLNAAINCGHVIWARGLVKNGYGLAEGVAGNAYALMALYKHTQNEKYRKQALMMAQYCFNYGACDDPCRQTPKEPLSLYEGLPGVIYMLYDFTTQNPKLPGYQL